MSLNKSIKTKTGAILSTEIALTLAASIVVLFACIAIFHSNVGKVFSNTHMQNIFQKERTTTPLE